MTPRGRAFAQFLILVVTVVLLLLVFPRSLRFVEAAARELRYLWWLILLLALGGWLVWGSVRRPKK